MQRQSSATGQFLSGHYLVVADVPMVRSHPVRLPVAISGLTPQDIGIGGTGPARPRFRMTGAANYDLRRFNYELVVRVFHRA